MSSPQLTTYISQQRQAGISDDQIRSSLLSSGWQAGDVDIALGGGRSRPVQPVQSQQPTATPKSNKRWLTILIAVIVVILVVASLFWYLKNKDTGVPQELTQLNEQLLDYQSREELIQAIDILKNHKNSDNEYFQEEKKFLESKLVILDFQNAMKDMKDNDFKCSDREGFFQTIRNAQEITSQTNPELLEEIEVSSSLDLFLPDQDSWQLIERFYEDVYRHTCVNPVSTDLPVSTTGEITMLVERIMSEKGATEEAMVSQWDDVVGPSNDIRTGAGIPIALDRDYWFYFIDYDPGAMFAHDVLYLFIDKDSGDYIALEEQWYPVIDGNAFLGVIEEDQLTVEEQISVMEPSRDSGNVLGVLNPWSVPEASAQELAEGNEKYAILIAGSGDLTAFQNEAAIFYHLVKDRGYKDENIEYLSWSREEFERIRPDLLPHTPWLFEGTDALTSKANFRSAVNKIANKIQCGDDFFLSYGGHGSNTGIDGHWINKKTGENIWTVLPEEPPSRDLWELMNTSEVWTFDIGKDSDGTMIAASSNEIIHALNKMDSCNKMLVLDSCFSGKGMAEIVADSPGTTVLAATKADEVGRFSWPLVIGSNYVKDYKNRGDESIGIIGPGMFILKLYEAIDKNGENLFEDLNNAFSVVQTQGISRHTPQRAESTLACTCEGCYIGSLNLDKPTTCTKEANDGIGIDLSFKDGSWRMKYQDNGPMSEIVYKDNNIYEYQGDCINDSNEQQGIDCGCYERLPGQSICPESEYTYTKNGASKINASAYGIIEHGLEDNEISCKQDTDISDQEFVISEIDICHSQESPNPTPVLEVTPAPAGCSRFLTGEQASSIMGRPMVPLEVYLSDTDRDRTGYNYAKQYAGFRIDFCEYGEEDIRDRAKEGALVIELEIKTMVDSLLTVSNPDVDKRTGAELLLHTFKLEGYTFEEIMAFGGESPIPKVSGVSEGYYSNERGEGAMIVNYDQYFIKVYQDEARWPEAKRIMDKSQTSAIMRRIEANL
ncbi:MAG: hypothetical protein ABH833_04210 [Parcubacteria group bacterium]